MNEKSQNPAQANSPIDNVPASLADALADLRAARQEAAEERFAPPSDATIQNAERLQNAMHAILPCRYEVYPTPDGEIAIDAPAKPRTAVIAICEPGGNALRFVHTDARKKRRRFPAADLPNEFLRDGLLSLAIPA